MGKLKLDIAAIEPDFRAENDGIDENGLVVLKRGDELFRVYFSPVLLERKEFERLLSCLKQHQIEVQYR